ncbi:Acyl-CoA reductase (LuxC) [Bacteroides luti]|uniref:Acyl-CoA reductase (LuxC) n=1 Tax=Bacteroides luti TaxID=1297750 RepID=A0A1M4WH19_9BACE|nr:acyl-CoA reductase [Bacteroides luti]SHE80581.1 Acyl-CoA reductase (LuxC) [Bacteroides luti]
MNNVTKVDSLLSMSPYNDSEESNNAYWEALSEELQFQYQNNEMYHNFCDRKGFNPMNGINSLESIPPVAVSVFKELGFKLNSVPQEDLTMALQSSATSGIPSTIVVDKITSKRQAKAMVKVVSEFIGNERIPFLIMDIDPKSTSRKVLGARFAAVTGYLKFASKVGYFLKTDENNISYFDVYGISEYLEQIATGQPVIVFGFTYILYQNVLKSIKNSNIKFQLPKGSKVIHIGGWKKLESEKISKEDFNKELSDCFSIDPIDIIDIYGFTEQMGLNYPDCPCGCKHASSYVKVLVRDVVTRDILPVGKEGMLEFITPIPHSYPGNAVLTDDLGELVEGECPYGRSGQRFLIKGRLKKAEVRGCGDILSNKLTFQKSNNSIDNEDSKLDIQYFKNEVIGELGYAKLDSIIEQLKSKLNWIRQQPIESLIGLIDLASKRWISDPKFSFLKDKGLLFLSNWCSATHLNDIAKEGLRGNIAYCDTFQPFASSSKHLLRANSRGLCGHWMAGNVQILGVFALVQCIITKNVNLLKVSGKDDGVFATLLSVFEGLEYTSTSGYTISGNDLLETIAVVYFSRSAVKLGEKMSKASDVRIAWGGKESVETVANYPSMIDSETIIFGPKLSYAVIASEELSSEQAAKKLARRVSVDVSVFDQSGCASPHNLYIEKSGTVTPERFCEILAESFPKTELQIPKPAISPEQVSAIHSARGIYDFKGKVWGSDSMSWSILYDDENIINKPVYSRVLIIHSVDHINDTLQHIGDYIQTIGIAAPEDKAIDFANKATMAGVARCPLIGRMLNFEMPWDGMFLIDRLVKWNTLFGPLL